MTIEIISLSIFTKVWGQAGIQLGIPGSSVRCASVVRQVTDCATLPVSGLLGLLDFFFPSTSRCTVCLQTT